MKLRGLINSSKVIQTALMYFGIINDARLTKLNMNIQRLISEKELPNCPAFGHVKLLNHSKIFSKDFLHHNGKNNFIL